MADKPIAAAILDEAHGAHVASRKILDLMQEPAAEDPIAAILLALQMIQNGQARILTRLEIIERRLASLD